MVYNTGNTFHNCVPAAHITRPKKAKHSGKTAPAKTAVASA